MGCEYWTTFFITCRGEGYRYREAAPTPAELIRIVTAEAENWDFFQTYDI